METSRQNRNPDQTLGSRFSALATLDLNMDTEDPRIENEAEKETVSNPDTNSSLVVTAQAGDRDMEISRNGRRTLGDKENIPRRNQMETRVAGPTNEAPVRSRPTTTVHGSDSIRVALHGPNIVHHISTSRPPTTGVNRSQAGPNRRPDNAGPSLTSLDRPPGAYTLPRVGCEDSMQRQSQHDPPLGDQTLEHHPKSTHGSMEMDP